MPEMPTKPGHMPGFVVCMATCVMLRMQFLWGKAVVARMVGTKKSMIIHPLLHLAYYLEINMFNGCVVMAG